MSIRAIDRLVVMKIRGTGLKTLIEEAESEKGR